MSECILYLYLLTSVGRIREILSCSREGGNREDPFAVLVQKFSATVGHVPRRISCVCSRRRFDATPHQCSLCPKPWYPFCRIITSLFIKMAVIRSAVSGGLNFHGTKLSRMAVEPRKPRKFSTAKIKVHTVSSQCLSLHTSCGLVYTFAALWQVVEYCVPEGSRLSPK